MPYTWIRDVTGGTHPSEITCALQVQAGDSVLMMLGGSDESKPPFDTLPIKPIVASDDQGNPWEFIGYARPWWSPDTKGFVPLTDDKPALGDAFCAMWRTTAKASGLLTGKLAWPDYDLSKVQFQISPLLTIWTGPPMGRVLSMITPQSTLGPPQSSPTVPPSNTPQFNITLSEPARVFLALDDQDGYGPSLTCDTRTITDGTWSLHGPPMTAVSEAKGGNGNAAQSGYPTDALLVGDFPAGTHALFPQCTDSFDFQNRIAAMVVAFALSRTLNGVVQSLTTDVAALEAATSVLEAK